MRTGEWVRQLWVELAVRAGVQSSGWSYPSQNTSGTTRRVRWHITAYGNHVFARYGCQILTQRERAVDLQNCLENQTAHSLNSTLLERMLSYLRKRQKKCIGMIIEYPNKIYAEKYLDALRFKGLHIAGAMLALLSLFLMIMGSVCITMSLSKSVPFFLKPATICFVFSGILVLLSIIIFHQSVLALLASDHSIPLHHELSWSVACLGSAGAILIFGGLMFLLLSLPYNPLEKCFRQQSSSDA
ncbi:uncharacterized protein cacng6b [Onychostoma macrolepis]|uniref:uncharacterized protein cacng6b n=1 Tax=Onychostoma macrolepis TaxID=369639 RepID=UPI00272B87A7|nr:uncharacterized protein cacng6b [Onychostoma macrolepis]